MQKIIIDKTNSCVFSYFLEVIFMTKYVKSSKLNFDLKKCYTFGKSHLKKNESDNLILQLNMSKSRGYSVTVTVYF